MSANNKALFSAPTQREIKKNMITGLNGLYPDAESIHVKSEYSKGDSECKLLPIVVSAVAKLADSNTAIGLFSIGGKTGFALEITEAGERQAAVVTNDMKVSACKIDSITKESSPYVFKSGHNSGVLLITAILVWISYTERGSSEANAAIKNCINLIKEGITEANIQQFGENAAVLSENLKRRSEFTVPQCLNDTGSVTPITAIAIDSGKYKVSRVDMGRFKILPSIETMAKPLKKQEELFLKGREFTETEKQLTPVTPDWYVEPKEVDEICSLIKKTTGLAHPKRNFMLRGPSSTGKTSMVRAIAAKLGMPYVYITCSADTESYAFLGQPMYDSNGNVKYVESDFIRAIKNGWVVEVQEPYVIAKQGVLTSLNGLLDDSAGITLASGEFVQRHPDAIVFFTTNVSYVGCKKPNQSVLRRMNNVYDINMPTQEEIIARVKSVTKFDDDITLGAMASCLSDINEYLINNYIDDGVCGVSELIDWVQTTQVLGNPLAAAETTIVAKATDEPSSQRAIFGLIEAKVQGDSSSEKWDQVSF
ncbi:MAG: AAA family ATPase [Bacteroidales bacterium]|nr:AAA family ATPase [Bacteroidales bacterium]